MSITTSRDCPWAISGEPAWISINGNRSGQGEARVPYIVSPNEVPSPRSGSITVDTIVVRVSQAAAPCHFDLSRTQDSIGRAGGRLTLAVTTLSGCQWSVVSSVPWITIAAGQSVTDSGTIQLEVARNNGSARVGTVSVGGTIFTVNQSASEAPPPPAPAPSPPPTAPTPPPPAPIPPPEPEQVDIVAVNRDVSGDCPDVTFSAGSYTVATSRSTKYDHMGCRDLERRARLIRVKGVLRTNGVVEATEIARVRDDD
jgi:hypothetical protein